MIEAYKIAVNMTLTGDAHKKMGDFAKQSEKASKAFKILSTDLKNVNRLFGTLTKLLDTANPSLKMLVRTFGIFGDQMRNTNRSMDYFNEGLRMSEGNTSRLRYQADTLRNSLRSLSAAGREARASLTGIGRGRIGGGGAGAAGGSLGGSAAAFLRGTGLGAATTYLGPYAAAMGVGATLKAGFTQNEQYNKYTGQLQALGYSKSDIARVRSLTTNVTPYTTPAKQMEAYIAASQATKSKSRAEKLFPMIAKQQAIATSLYGGMTQDQMSDAIRAAEFLGGSDEDKIASYLQDVYALQALSGGTFKPNQIRQMLSMGVSGLSRRGLLELEPIAQEMRGSKVGTALTTGANQLIGGHYSNKAQALDLEAMGIIGPQYTKMIGGKKKRFFGTLSKERARLYNQEPEEFYEQVIRPAYAKRGITNLADIQSQLIFDFPRTTSRLYYNIEKSFDKIQRNKQAIANLPAGLGLGDIAGQAPEAAAVSRVTNSYLTFATALGKLTDPFVTGGMNNLSNFLDKITVVLQYIGKGTDAISSLNDKSSDFLSKHGVTSTDINMHPYLGPIGVFIDGYKVGQAIVSHLAGNQNVHSGTQAITSAYSGQNNNVNNPGGFPQ